MQSIGLKPKLILTNLNMMFKGKIMNDLKLEQIDPKLVIRPKIKRHTRPAQAASTSSDRIVLGIVYVLCTAILVGICGFWIRTLLLYV